MNKQRQDHLRKQAKVHTTEGKPIRRVVKPAPKAADSKPASTAKTKE